MKAKRQICCICKTTLYWVSVLCQGLDIVLVCSGCHKKVAQTGQFKQRSSFSRSSGGWKPETKALAGLVPSETSLLSL